MIYKDFRIWAEAVKTNTVLLFLGVCGLLFSCLVMGTMSLLYAVIRKINAFYRRETVAAAIIIFIGAAGCVGFIATFVKERHYRVQAEHRADSLAYDLSKFTQMYDSTDIIVINGDTVKSR